MAKSRSFFGLRRGSTKSLTFQVLNGQQITKDRVSQVRNPKTSGQIMQRMKLSAANVIYRYFKTYIDRGQQGVTYGNKSRNAWLKTILAGAALYNPKGANVLLPWSFQMTKGSLQPFSYSWDGESNLKIDENDGAIDASDEVLLSLNKQLLDGDQITVICMSQMPGGTYQIFQASHIIGKDANIVDVMQENGIDITSTAAAADGDKLATFQPLNGTVAGTCIILSRLNGSAYERSTQDFIGNEIMFTDDFRKLATESYRDAEARSHDWPEVVEGGFIPFGKTSVQVNGTVGGQTVAFAALAVYGFAGNEYRLYCVTASGDSETTLYDVRENTTTLIADDAKVGTGANAVNLGDYVTGYLSKPEYDELYG